MRDEKVGMKRNVFQTVRAYIVVKKCRLVDCFGNIRLAYFFVFDKITTLCVIYQIICKNNTYTNIYTSDCNKLFAF